MYVVVGTGQINANWPFLERGGSTAAKGIYPTMAEANAAALARKQESVKAGRDDTYFVFLAISEAVVETMPTFHMKPI